MRFPFNPRSSLKWLYPGMAVKRWFLLLIFGITVIGLGFSYLLRDIYESWAFPPFFYYLTLQFIPRLWRALLFGIVGTAAVFAAVVQLNRSLLAAFLRPGQEVVDVVYRSRQRHRGPKVVAIGGGTGLSTLLRGLKEYTDNLTAIVTVADDGGSSGRLRRELGVLPPGDFRNCLAALADAESLITQLFQYRFGEGMALGGHSFGNLFIAAMVAITGNFERAILESGRVLAIRGRIVPSTLQNVTLCADLQEDVETGQGLRRVEGESQIPATGQRIERVFLRPDRVRAYPGALRAILQADLIVAGPGSLYTSILPNLLIEDIVRAIRASSALKIYVCNVATQPGETDGFSIGDHVGALQHHVGRDLFDYVLVNDHLGVELPSNVEVVGLGYDLGGNCEVITTDLIDPDNPWRHDAHKLARSLMDSYDSRRNQGLPRV